MTNKISSLALTTSQVAKKTGFSLRTIQLWCNQGVLKYELTPGGHRRFNQEWVDEFLKKITSIEGSQGVTACTHIHKVVAGNLLKITVGNIRQRIKNLSDTCQIHTLRYTGSDGVVVKSDPVTVNVDSKPTELSMKLRLGTLQITITRKNAVYLKGTSGEFTPMSSDVDIVVQFSFVQ